MSKVSVDVTKLRAIVSVKAERELERQAEILKRLCQEECPVQTGRLLASHKVEDSGLGRRSVVADTPYARNVFDGEGPNGARRPNRWMLRGIDRMRT